MLIVGEDAIKPVVRGPGLGRVISDSQFPTTSPQTRSLAYVVLVAGLAGVIDDMTFEGFSNEVRPCVLFHPLHST